MNVIATLNKNVSLDNMVLCYFNIRPKLKCKHICNLINERHGVPLTMRRLLQICKKLGLKSDCHLPKNFCQIKISLVFFKEIPLFVCLVFKNENK